MDKWPGPKVMKEACEQVKPKIFTGETLIEIMNKVQKNIGGTSAQYKDGWNDAMVHFLMQLTKS